MEQNHLLTDPPPPKWVTSFMDGPYLYEILICFKKIEIKIHEEVDFVPTFTLPSYVAWLELFMKD